MLAKEVEFRQIWSHWFRGLCSSDDEKQFRCILVIFWPIPDCEKWPKFVTQCLFILLKLLQYFRIDVFGPLWNYKGEAGLFRKTQWFVYITNIDNFLTKQRLKCAKTPLNFHEFNGRFSALKSGTNDMDLLCYFFTNSAFVKVSTVLKRIVQNLGCLKNWSLAL